MKRKHISEVLLTSNYVTKENWLDFIFSISKLNGLFKKWNLYVYIDKNKVRYFIETSRKLPTVLNSLGDFLLKELDDSKKINYYPGIPYIIKNREKTVIDIYDRNESKYSKVLKLSKITILPYKKNNFLYFTYLFFENSNKKLIRKTAFFNIPHEFLSIDFSIHNRFFYTKDAARYLNIEKSLCVLENSSQNAILKADTFPYFQNNLYLSSTSYDFDKHSIIVGSSGTGKSKLISLLVSSITNNKDLASNYKFVIIDPHAAIENDIGGINNSCVIDFKELDSSLNLFINNSEDAVSSTELILSLFKTLIADQYNSRLERVLRHSIHLLIIGESLNFTNLRKLILDSEFRNTFIKQYENYAPLNIIEFFLTDFNELKNKSYQESIAPIISFIDEMQLLPAFNLTADLKNIKECIEENFLTILSLDQTSLGESITKTVSGLAMQQILQLIQEYTFKEHIILIVDEVSIVENLILRRFLSEARKYNLSLILSQQFFGQISDELKKSIFANVVNYYIFRVSRMDAGILESNLQMEVAVKNSFTMRMKILTELNNRECIVRACKDGKILSAIQCRTLDFKPIPRIKKVKKHTLDTSKKEKSPLFKFSIDTKVNLKNLMSSQSSSRKKVFGNE